LIVVHVHGLELAVLKRLIENLPLVVT
jgi:hypothetical protein